MTANEKIKVLCRLNKIPVSKLETDLGYGNGYLMKTKHITFDRLQEIADYFKVPVSEFSVGSQLTSLAYETAEENQVKELFKKLDDDDKETILRMMEVMIQNSKYKKDKDQSGEVG